METIQKRSGISRDQQCLALSGYECNCPLKEIKLRKRLLHESMQKIGAYTLSDLALDPSLGEAYQREKRELCEGTLPNIWQRIRNNLPF